MHSAYLKKKNEKSNHQYACSDDETIQRLLKLKEAASQHRNRKVWPNEADQATRILKSCI